MSLYPPDLEDTEPDDLLYPEEPLRSPFRVLLTAAVGPLVIGYATVAAVLALVISVATRAAFSTGSVLSAAMPGWLAVHQVPLTLGGQQFGALPLLPTLAIMLLVRRAAVTAADRLMVESARDTVPIIATIAASHAVAGVVFAEVTSTATFVAGLLVPGLVAGAAAAVGLARRGYFADALGRLDEMVTRGLRAGLLGLSALLAVGAALFLFGLATSLPTVQTLFEASAPGAGNGLGMFLLCAMYLPNAVIAGVSFAAGSGVAIGHLSVTPLHFTGGPLPAVPILAALPERGAAWWPVVLLFPLLVGALVGWVLRDVCEDPIARLRAVGVAAVVIAAGYVVLGLGAGGRLASGVFNPLTVHPWSLGMALLLLIALPAAAVAWWTGPRLELAPARSLLDDAIEAEEEAEPEAEEDAAEAEEEDDEDETELVEEPEEEDSTSEDVEPEPDPDPEIEK
jgi:hypothetical protein